MRFNGRSNRLANLRFSIIQSLARSAALMALLASALLSVGLLTAISASEWLCEGGMQEGSLITLELDEDVICTITNDDDLVDVIFEGIPTLNQYGLALLALLMLGIGIIGFRRFS